MSPLSKAARNMSAVVIWRLLPSHTLGEALPLPPAPFALPPAPGFAVPAVPEGGAPPAPEADVPPAPGVGDPLSWLPGGDERGSPEHAAIPATSVQARPTLAVEGCIRFMEDPSRWRFASAHPNDGARRKTAPRSLAPARIAYDDTDY